jgi:hypothetical protein
MSAFGGKAAARRHAARCLGIISGIPILVVHQDGAKNVPPTCDTSARWFLRTEDVADRQPKRFSHDYTSQVSNWHFRSLVNAPAIVRVGSLMSIRGVVTPLRKNYYGFCDRLWIKSRYENGELRGPALMRMIEERILQVPPAILAYDLARWGAGDLSLVAREERREALWPV